MKERHRGVLPPPLQQLVQLVVTCHVMALQGQSNAVRVLRAERGRCLQRAAVQCILPAACVAGGTTFIG